MVAVGVLSSPALGSEDGSVVALRLDGVVDPFEASYISSQIEAAADEGADAVLVTMDTPGGLDSSMREIVQAILNSPIPVVCYVSPDGARAASAGAFILTACHIAAMAPGTNVGAASPVGVSGAIEQRKVMNDAVAFLRSLAEQRDRNPEWAEDAVRDARSSSAEEAVDLGVVDLIAGTQRELLDTIDGRNVTVQDGDVTLDTAGAAVTTRELGVGSALLHSLFTTDLAFIFFYLGLGLLIVEFLHPGVSVPGVLGVLSLVAAFAGFGMLPVSLVGVALLTVSAAFFLVELKHPGLGVPGGAGLVTLVVGGLLLFDGSGTGARVSPLVIAPVAGLMLLFFLLVIPAALRARKLPLSTLGHRLIGAMGVATTDLTPAGNAQIASERWSVESVGGEIKKGDSVRVIGAQGLRLKVEPVVHQETASSATQERSKT